MNERTLEARPGRLGAVRREADRQVIHPKMYGVLMNHTGSFPRILLPRHLWIQHSQVALAAYRQSALNFRRNGGVSTLAGCSGLSRPQPSRLKLR